MPHCPRAYLALALFLGACSNGPASPPRPRGVLLVSIDSLRADHLSCYGYRSETAPDVPTSPIIDRELAESGVVFEQAVSTTSWTLPAHMALLTGQPDELHGVRHAAQKLHSSQPLLAELMQRSGWRTGGFFSGPNVHPHFGFGRGFERYVDCSTHPVGDGSVFDVSQTTEEVQGLKELQRLSHQGVTGPKLVAAFEEWFDTVADDERFFAFVHMWDVHYDYAAPEEYVRRFDPDYAGTVNGANFWDLDEAETRDPRDVQHVKALYDAEIRYTDDHVGILLDMLRARGRLDDTLVVLVSDHGEEFFEHGRFGHARTLFEEVVRVPILMRYPPVLSPARTDALVSLTDVLPTVLELCDLAPPRGVFGRSLLPVLAGGTRERAVPMEVTFRRIENFLEGYRERDFKVVRHSKSKDPELYELDRDPGEERGLRKGAGLAPDDPRLTAARRLWAELSRAAELFERVAQGELPPGLEEQMRALGYLGKDE